jgi:hypothetical protein
MIGCSDKSGMCIVYDRSPKVVSGSCSSSGTKKYRGEKL